MKYCLWGCSLTASARLVHSLWQRACNIYINIKNIILYHMTTMESEHHTRIKNYNKNLYSSIQNPMTFSVGCWADGASFCKYELWMLQTVNKEEIMLHGRTKSYCIWCTFSWEKTQWEHNLIPHHMYSGARLEWKWCVICSNLWIITRTRNIHDTYIFLYNI